MAVRHARLAPVQLRPLGMAGKRLTATEIADALASSRTGYVFTRPPAPAAGADACAARAAANAGVDYERLEFLGDRVLGLVVADMLLADFPDAPEGELSVRLNALVNAETLAEIADEIGPAELIRAGARGAQPRRAQARQPARRRARSADRRRSISTAAWMRRALHPRILEAARRGRGCGPPRRQDRIAGMGAPGRKRGSRLSRSRAATGPDHDPVFTVSVEGRRLLRRRPAPGAPSARPSRSPPPPCWCAKACGQNEETAS